MADVENTSIPAPAEAATATPAVASPVVESTVSTPTVPVVENQVSPVADTTPKKEDISLLGAEETVASEVKPEVKIEDKKPEVKADDKKPEIKAEDEKSIETKPADGEVKSESPDQVALPSYEEFKMPENFKKDEKILGEFTKMLGEFEASKPDHAKFQEFGQKALEFHVARLQEQAQSMTDYFVQLHEKRVNDEREALRKDPVIGGNGDDKTFEKTTRDLANFIAANGGSKQEVTEFRQYVQQHGVDNALPIARVLLNLKSKIDRYENEGSKILPGTKPATSKPAHPGMGIMNKLYGKS